VVQGNFNHVDCSVELCHALFRDTDRAGGRLYTFLHEPSRPCDHLPFSTACSFSKNYSSPPLSPLFGFAAVKQEDEAEGHCVLVFDPRGKCREAIHRELRHISPVLKAR